MEPEEGSEIDIRSLVRRLCRGWRIIVSAAALAFMAGVALYFFVPRTYQSSVTILPITESDYSRYVDLVAQSVLSDMLDESQKSDNRLTTFPYSRDDLLNEFTTYLQSPDHLLAAVKASGIVDEHSVSDNETEAAALAFVRSVSFTPATERKPTFEMRVHSGNPTALSKFIAASLDNARIGAANNVRESIVTKIDAREKLRNEEIAKRMIDITSRRQQAESVRNDDMMLIGEQARIAEALRISDPVTLQALSRQAEDTNATSVQVFGGDQPYYLQGSIALNEQIDLLKNRKDNDPYTAGLRDVQREIYLLENDNRASALRALLDESPLKDPSTAPIARYSRGAASVTKIFPSASIFGFGSLLLGLLVGAGIVLLREENDVPTPRSKSTRKA